MVPRNGPSALSEKKPWPAVAIVGPTASGKSDLGLHLAKRTGGEIVNFDSVQAYRFLDIGSAKPSLATRAAVRHHLMDHVAPDEVYSAGAFARDAREVLREMRERGRLPILVGGTGFYLEALLDGLFDAPPRDEALRERLDESAASHAPGYLWRLLARLDRRSADAIHPNDHAKLVRAIEVCLAGGRPMSDQWKQPRRRLRGFRVLLLGLAPAREDLHARIDERSRQMFDEGLVDEVRSLLERGIRKSWRPLGSLGYKQCLRYLEDDCILEEAVTSTAAETRRYAKRQMTWFRNRTRNVRWLGAFGNTSRAARWAEAEFERWIDGSGPCPQTTE